MCYSDIVIRRNEVGHSTYYAGILDRQISIGCWPTALEHRECSDWQGVVMGRNDQKEERLRPPTPFRSAVPEVPDAVPPRLKNE